ADAELLDHLAAADHRRPRGVAVLLAPGAGGEHGLAAERRGSRPRWAADRTGVPAISDLVELARALLADQDVDAVAGAQSGRATGRDRLVVAHDHVDDGVAR